jgi:hypothetical protein
MSMPEITDIPEHPQADSQADTNGGEPAGKAGRGREDRVWRLRALVWLSVVRAHKKCPWEPAAMDRHFLGEDAGDGRGFWRVLRYARDPGLPRASWGGLSLVDRVGATRGFEHTAAVYHSVLWADVLGPSSLEPARREILIGETLKRLGLFEPAEEDRFAESVLALGLDELRAIPARVLRQRVARLARLRSVDAILLLCLYYRRAIEATQMEEARIFAQGALDAIGRFCRRPGVPGGVDGMWTFMTRRRVLAGQQSLAHTPQVQQTASLWLASRRERAAAAGRLDSAALSEQAWQLGCVLDNQTDLMPATSFHSRTLALEAYMASRAGLIDDARARGVEQALARAETSAATWTPAQRRFAELPGHSELVPLEWT